MSPVRTDTFSLIAPPHHLYAHYYRFWKRVFWEMITGHRRVDR